jgi:hypothetical protein
MGNGRDASRAVHLETKKASHVLRSLTDMDAHPHAKLLTRRPLMFAEGPLYLDDGGHAGSR